MQRMLKYTFALMALCWASLAQAQVAAWSGDRALFWSMENDEGRAGYLLGTIHSEDPRVLEFTAEFLERLGNSDKFAMELVPDIPTLARLAEFMHLPDGQSLADVIGQERFDAVAGALQSYSMSPGQVARLKPWAAVLTLSVPPPETGLFMDFSLSLRASGGGVKVVGLETLEDQLSFLEDMSLDHQLLMLDHAIAEFDQVEKVHDLMVDTYLKDDIGVLTRLTNEQMETLDEETRRYFVEEGIDARNHRMLERLLPHLAEGTVFVAVGALHLPGEEGLIQLLRDQGYRLSPLPLPLPAATKEAAAQ